MAGATDLVETMLARRWMQRRSEMELAKEVIRYMVRGGTHLHLYVQVWRDMRIED
jgi:acyl carrier protein phosphodiesterase